MSEKCNTCMLRYPCDEMTEWECKHNGYRHYKPDASKIAELEGKAPTGCQESRRPKTARELKDTIDLMTSADYKDRFRAEYFQLKIRHDKLAAVIEKYKNHTLDFIPDCPISLLAHQLIHMRTYLDILEERAEIEGVELNWPAKEDAPTAESKNYLAVYWYTSNRASQGIGNTEVTVNGTPTSFDIIRELERGIRERNDFRNVVLLNLIPLEG